MDSIDLSCLSALAAAACAPPPPHVFPSPRDGSPGEAAPADGAAADERRAAEALEVTRAERASRKGKLVRRVLGAASATHVIDLGEYRSRRKVKVFVQYQRTAAPDEGDLPEVRVALVLPDGWVDSPISKLKKAFLQTYNSRFPKRALQHSQCLLAVHDGSYLAFSRDILRDDALIGDVVHENDELFLVTETDVRAIDSEVKRLANVLATYEDEARQAATIDARGVVEMTTVSRQVDPFVPHVLLIGMHQMYMLPVAATYTVADVKLFIHHKAGPDRFPIGCLDVALVEDLEINILSDDLTIEDLAKRVYGHGGSLIDQDGEKSRKVAVPLYWGTRLQDPKYFLWIPTLHAAGSFKGPEDAKEPDAREVAQQTTKAGGECPVS
ncbi:hypothetical protein M885DRAFT_621680 [Pelagophyceae sp. CCMP2097]|nr:hypothetical protein M885DRAFT_621680 [Pelagophyceae sp. CCMP2097]